jgi:hypothetical protein
VSPPDTGTQSPLDWSPGLNFEFEDLEQTSFLNPSLRVAGKRTHKKRHKRARNHGGGNDRPSNSATPPSLLPGLPAMPLTNDLSNPTSASPFEPSLSPQ